MKDISSADEYFSNGGAARYLLSQVFHMKYLALACDYDGTVADHGRVAAPTLAAFERLLASGRHLILVTGRELDDLLANFPHAELCEWIVAENGCVLYRPATQERQALCELPPRQFVAALRRRGVAPLAVGEVIVSTRVPHEGAVLEVIRELGLELQLIFNKGAVMVLPAGKNKASGLAAAIEMAGLSPHNVVGVGDAENDHAFLDLCGCAVAVANALPMVQQKADFVTGGAAGAGVAELIDELVGDDLASRDRLLARHQLLLGVAAQGGERRVALHRANIMLAGSSGSGKSTIVTGILERLAEQHYQYCVVDPEGDYENFEGAVSLGQGHRIPTVDEALHVLRNPRTNLIVNLVGIAFKDRPAFFTALLSRLAEQRATKGRPHAVIVDEAHHVLPASSPAASLALPHNIKGVIYVTVEPQSVAAAVLTSLDTLLAVGAAEKVFSGFAGVTGRTVPGIEKAQLERGEMLCWEVGSARAPIGLRAVPGRAERRRHRRKYAEGDLGAECSFYFRGRDGKLNLKAQNLIVFMQLADGVDDQTWEYHLRRGDYAQWFLRCIKDETLGAEALKVQQRKISAVESRQRIKAAITQRFTLPAT